MRLYLIGFMGSGKSTLGREVADRLGISFWDLDEYVESKAQKSIPVIFEEEGEAYFRNLEKGALHDSFDLGAGIISTGGGSPCFFDNMKAINRNGTSVFLNASVDELVKRLKGEQEQRPLLKGKSDEELTHFIATKLSGRLPFYEKAHYEIDTDGFSIYELTDMLIYIYHNGRKMS